MVFKMENDSREFKTIKELIAAYEKDQNEIFRRLPLHLKVFSVVKQHIWEPAVYIASQVAFKIKSLYQKIIYGYADYEIWNLDQTIACYILPRLTEFRQQVHGYPDDITYEEWLLILNKMINAFQKLSEGVHYKFVNDENEIKECNKEIREGLDLFSKYFSHLWL